MRLRAALAALVVLVFVACRDAERELSPTTALQTRRLIGSYPQRPPGWFTTQKKGTTLRAYTVEETRLPSGSTMTLRQARFNDASFGALTTGGCFSRECQVVRTRNGELMIHQVETDEDRDGCTIVEVDPAIRQTGDFRPFNADPPPCQPDLGDIITVAVFYTAEAEKVAGSRKDMIAHVDFAAGATNEALRRSAVPTQIEIVGPRPLAINDKARPVDFLQHVETHDLRGNADLLVLITTSLHDCGEAFRHGSLGYEGHLFAPYAYAVVRIDCMSCGNWSFGHEIGHLLGACHESSKPCDPPQDNFDYIDEPNSFKTLSASGKTCAKCDRINQWSSLTEKCDTMPTGSKTENNTQRIADTHVSVAKFRCR